MYGAAHGITFDDELYYVSALLHDIGLTKVFDSHTVEFEEAGGDLAWVFGVAAGWSADRAARATEIIVLHMRDDVSPAADPESHIFLASFTRPGVRGDDHRVRGQPPGEHPGSACAARSCGRPARERSPGPARCAGRRSGRG